MVPKPQVKTLALTKKASIPGLQAVCAVALLLFSSTWGVPLLLGQLPLLPALLALGTWDYLVSATSGQVTEELN